MADWRVLVVDDDTHMLDLMSRRLGRMGIQPDRAQDGKTALGMVQQTAYDLILTDIYMPGGTGLEILRKAKENDPHVQVIVVTGSATLDNAVEALNMGAFSYLSKPFDHMSVFDNSVSRALEFRRLIRDNQRMADIQRRRGDMLEAEVTDRIRQMRRRQQDMVDLLARLPEGVLVVDGEGRTLLSNATAEEWLAREARLEVQPLRRYLSTLTPPRRPTKSETEIDGVYLRLTAQALPPEEGKPRILVTIGETGEESSDIRRQLSGSVGRLRPGLDWLARQALDEKETDVVRLLLTQVAAIETMLGPEAVEGRGRRVAEVDWEGVDLKEGPEPEAAEVAVEATTQRTDESTRVEAPRTPAAPQWPPPRAGEEGPRPAPPRKKTVPSAPPKAAPDEQHFETVLLSQEPADMGVETEAAAVAPAPAPPGEAGGKAAAAPPGIEAGLERLLQHLAETPAPEEPELPMAEAAIEPEVEEVPEAPPPPPAPPPAAPEIVEEAPPRRGLLGKMRREGKEKVAPVEAPSPAPERKPEPKEQASEPAQPATPGKGLKPPEPGRLKREPLVKEQAEAPSPPLRRPASGRLKGGPLAKEQPEAPSSPSRRPASGRLKPEPAAEPAAPSAAERPSGLLGKVRRSLKQSGAVQETPLQPVKAPASGPIEGERHRTPIPERAPSPDKDLSELLEAVREAAGATDRVESGETPPMEEPGDRPSKPPAKKKQWPPPPPSQEDIDE